MAVAAAAAIDAEPYNPNPLLVIDKHSNDKLTRFKTDEVTFSAGFVVPNDFNQIWPDLELN